MHIYTDWNEKIAKKYLVSSTHHVPLHAPGFAASALAGYYVMRFSSISCTHAPSVLHMDFGLDGMNFARLVSTLISVKWEEFVSSKKNTEHQYTIDALALSTHSDYNKILKISIQSMR